MKLETSPKIERKTDAGYLELLQKRLASLNEELKAAERQLKEIASTPTDSADEFGDRQNELQTAEETISRIKSDIEEAEKATRWAEKNGFVCAICRKEIETDRLNADLAPITCKKHMEEEGNLEI